IHIRELSRSNFENEALTQSSQGVIARAAPLNEYTLEQLARPIEGPGGTTPPFLLALDSVTDPGNLGAMLRTAECAGVTGVLLPRHRAARLTPTATKSAAGAIEHLPMAVVSGIAGALSNLSELGVWSVGLDGGAERSVWDMDLADQPLVLVMGAEGSGLSRLVGERCDALVRIPLAGALGSLNVASAAAVAMYEVVRRRGE
ncbi:MAG: 23S rRNA (guanosine(2251)-2'-O)-methyltransferase RlmB, partial [Acidimicrobiales bacterium]|nr:23S rRNA (guanosine(2251)-2'-O)-methyltransferase RlmB [Acidimicrobiales bacterium]